MRLEVRIWIKGKCYEFSVEAGWYRGNEFSLFSLDIFEHACEGLLTIIQLQVAKFIIGLHLSKVD